MAGVGRDRIGDFEIVDSLGQGSRGRVFRAVCVSDNNPNVKKDEVVALKILRMPGESNTAAERFRQQADMLRKLAHPNIIKTHDAFVWRPGEWDEAKCLVTEVLDGETLEDKLKRHPNGLPWAEVRVMYEGVISALLFAREQGIIHRDIKPSNLFILKDGSAKVFDFDIARHEEEGQDSTAAWKGTFDYMAPDFLVVPGFRGDEQSDIFSLGICFYQTITGKLPFEELGKGAHLAYLNRWHGPARPPEPSFRSGIFRVMSNSRRFVELAMAPNREQRFASFEQVSKALKLIQNRRIRHTGKDDYELLEVLGRGGFGEVFLARRARDGMKVAVKHLFAQQQSERFQREARMLERCENPHIVKYIDFFTVKTATDEQHYLVLEYLEGMPGWALRYRIKKEGRLPVEEVVPLFSAYLEALQFLHSGEKPVIHRDIKPTNLYAPKGHPELGRIFDLGVARDVTGTVTYGGVPGTLDYMAPEFATSGQDRGSPQSDLYALGLCLFEAVTGKLAFEKLSTSLNTAWKQFQERSSQKTALPLEDPVFQENPRLAEVIRRATAYDPDDRYRSAREMMDALNEVIAPHGPDAESPTMATHATNVSAVQELLPLSEEPEPPHAEAATIVPPPREPTPRPAPVSKPPTRPSAPPSAERPKPKPKAIPAPQPEPVFDDAGQHEPPPEDATIATRADALADGVEWASRYRMRKRLIAISLSVILALGLAFAGYRWLSSIPVSRTADNAAAVMAGVGEPQASLAYVESLEAARQQLDALAAGQPKLKAQVDIYAAQLAKLAGQVPDRFKADFATAAMNHDQTAAKALLAEWTSLESHLGTLEVSREDFEERQNHMGRMIGKVDFEQTVASLNARIPSLVRGDSDLATVDQAFSEQQELVGQVWEGVSPADSRQQLEQIGKSLTDITIKYIDSILAEAMQKSERGEAVTAEVVSLTAIPDLAPTLATKLSAPLARAIDQLESLQASSEVNRTVDDLATLMAKADTPALLSDAAQKYAAWQKTFPETPPAAADQKLTRILAGKYKAQAQDLQKRVRTHYEASQLAEGDALRKELQSLAANTPEKFGRLEIAELNANLEPVRRDAAARLESTALQRKQQELEQQQKAAKALAEQKERERLTQIAEAERRLAELKKRVVEGDAKLWGAAVKYLIDFDSPMISVPSVKKAWDDAASECRARIEGAIALKEPLDARAERLDALRQATLLKDADLVLGGSLAAMQEKIKTQQARFILRINNQAGQVLSISSGDLLKRTVVGSGQKIDILLPAGNGKDGVPFTIEAGEGYKPRTKIIALPPGGGAEMVLNALEAAAGKPVAAATATTPAESSTHGIFRVAVSPKDARIFLDDEEVQAGEIKVTSDDNHKIRIELEGYQLYEQYYRVSAGKTKDIDILLQKAAPQKKRGLF